MKKIRIFIIGMVVGVTIACTVGAFAYTDYIEAVYNNIKIVVDGKEIHPQSEPFISNGTTYLPVRAVSEALGKEVNWDGPNYTVYIGDMKGRLDYPSALLSDVENIGDVFWKVNSDNLTDNYDNSYSYAYMSRYTQGTFKTLLNMKYKRFKATICVPKGCNSDKTAKILIKTDGKVIYTSPEITKTSRPISVDIDITGCNVFDIEVEAGVGVYGGSDMCYIADGGFYQ